MRKPKVLVVDDDHSFRTEIAGLLNNNGYAASTTTSSEVLFRFLEIQPDIVFTEIVMTEQEGLELILKLRELRQDLTIIAVTGGERAGSYLKMAQLLGAKAALRRPFRAEELLNVVGSAAASIDCNMKPAV